jgi:transcriptional regulator with XRE-family HTH domain
MSSQDGAKKNFSTNEEEKYKSLGQRIKFLRIEKGLTQADLAQILFSTKTTISNYETGYSTPDLDTLLKIADYFNVTMDYLLGRVDKRVPNKYGFVSDEIVIVPILRKVNSKESLFTPGNIEGYEFVNKKLLDENAEYFYYHVTDDSINKIIKEDSLVLFKKSSEVRNGQLILYIDKDKPLLRYYYKDKIAILESASYNLEHSKLFFSDSDVQKENVIGIAEFAMIDLRIY